MALRQILEYPDPRLRTRAVPVTAFDAELSRLVDDMLETMYAAPGIGLAATQVNVHRQVIVIDVSKDGSQPQVFINPEIIGREGLATQAAGCLSVPRIFDSGERAARIRARARDRHGAAFEVELEGLPAVCLQHEMDHLDGRLFVDYLSGFKRDRIRRKLEKERRDRAARAPAERAPAGSRL